VRFLSQEVPLLLQSAGLLERDGARECAAQLFAPPDSVEIRSGTYRNYNIEEYPIQVGDQLRIYVPGRAIYSTTLRIEPAGSITLPRISAIAAVGKMVGQLEREIGSLLSEYHESAEVHVILVTSPSLDELSLEFDNALPDAAE
jgi:protein involved in polysaccharide export with SLBB domain